MVLHRILVSSDPAAKPPSSSGPGNTSTGGEPVDLASGLFTSSMTDLSIADVMPISITRSYLSSDANYHEFGLGVQLSYGMFIELLGGGVNTAASEEYSQLVLETPSSSVTFTNTTPAYGDFSDALFVEASQPGPFLGAKAAWTGNGFDITTRDGTTYAIGYHSPITYMQDRFGNRVSFAYEQLAPSGTGTNLRHLVKVTSPDGRFFQFTWSDLYPSGKHGTYTIPAGAGTDLFVITSAVDNLGRQTNYFYDACGRLTSVEDAQAVSKNQPARTTLTWTTSAPAIGTGACPSTAGQAPLNLLAQITDQNSRLLFENDQYEWSYASGGETYTSAYNCETPAVSGQTPQVTTGRVCHQQTGAPGTSSNPTFSFQYTVDANDNIETAVVTDPRSHTHKVDFMIPSEPSLSQQQSGTNPTPSAPAYTPGYPIDETYAADDSTNSQKFTYARDPTTFTLLQVTAPPLTEEGETAGRVTAFCYDNASYVGSAAPSSPYRPWNLTSVVRNLSSSGNPCPSAVQTGSTTQNATTLFTYSPTYNLATSVTDPNGNMTRFCRTSGQNGCPTQTYHLEQALSVIDANGNSTNFTYAANGQTQSTSRVASGSETLQSTFGYDHNDLVSVTAVGSTSSPQIASRTALIFKDAIGRSIDQTDPLGDVSTSTFNPIFGPTQVKNANGTYEDFTYNPNGTTNQISQPNGATTLSYNNANLVATFTDPLSNVGYLYYDASQNLVCTIDRNGNQANFTYDSLNRRTAATYYIGNTSTCSGTPSTVDSTVSFTYDHGNRLLTITDSVGGTTTRKFDDLDRITSDAQARAGSGTSIGSVAYTYDVGGRVTEAAASNVNPQDFSYDPANRVTAIVGPSGQGVCITYDQANRRLAVVYPSGSTASYSWDSLSDALGIAYTYGGSYTPGSNGSPSTCTLGTATPAGTGNLTYGYDNAGRQVARGGSFFTLVPPSTFAAGTVSYNADNQSTLWNGLYNYYDANGNLTCAQSSSSTAPTTPNVCPGQAFTWDARQRLITAGAQT